MRDPRAWLLLFLLGAATASTRCLAETGNAATLARASMVIVSSHIGPHRDAIGAGVVVAIEPHRLRVITARHVAEQGPVTIWIEGRPWPAEIVRTFANRDLAVVDAVNVHGDPLRIRPAVLAPTISSGSDLYVWGENETGLRIQTASVVSPAYQPPDGSDVAPLLRIACDSCASGDSGGGIFDMAGRLLGILTGRYHTQDDRTVAIVGERVDESIYAFTDGALELTASAHRAP